MQYQVIYTKPFNGYLRKLQQQGQKKVVQAVRAALTEAGMDGGIKSLPRTKHGETRIQDIEKYDLADGYRLVVQLVDGKAKVRAFLFVGSHDETDRWLDAHRNYRWTRNLNDGTLEFTQVTLKAEERHVPADRIDLESPEELLALPLLRVLSPDEWHFLRLSKEAQQFVSTICGNDYERDADGILSGLDQAVGWDKASLIFDLLTHAHAGEWPQLHQRISILNNEAAIVAQPDVVPAMLSPENSESFVTFDDADELNNFFENHSMADWMHFLHPEQKRVSERDFKGPARLRGVSGSGKTSVLVHRSRFLAKKYHQPMFLVTLTESMRKLLDHLADDLCGVERSLIFTMTISSLARYVVQNHPLSSTSYKLIGDDQFADVISEVGERIRGHSDFARTPLSTMEDGVLLDFLRDEISYVRRRLLPAELDRYLDSRVFQRRGRGFKLNETARSVLLEAIHFYEQKLVGAGLVDYEGIVAEALRLMNLRGSNIERPRCVLCDEVQDLSQLELALLGRLENPDGEQLANAENGLFLVGDGAQTIYKRGFTLRSIGIDIINRSFTLRKNYRNTYEILTAAFGLVSRYEFADVDEEDIVRPTEPEFAKRHGTRPMILLCSSLVEEVATVAKQVESLLAYGQTPGQICIVGPNSKIREEIQRALEQKGIASTHLRLDADFESDHVKVSTIESAKGHEFSAVFILGLVDGVLPMAGIPENEIPREAARLYVAMTRARDTLTLTCSPVDGYRASRFLLAIQTYCDEARIRDGQIRPANVT